MAIRTVKTKTAKPVEVAKDEVVVANEEEVVEVVKPKTAKKIVKKVVEPVVEEVEEEEVETEEEEIVEEEVDDTEEETEEVEEEEEVAEEVVAPAKKKTVTKTATKPAAKKTTTPAAKTKVADKAKDEKKPVRVLSRTKKVVEDPWSLEEFLTLNPSILKRSDLVQIVNDQLFARGIFKEDVGVTKTDKIIAVMFETLLGALDEGVQVYMNTKSFKRRLRKAALHKAGGHGELDKLLGTKDTLILPYVQMSMTVANGKESIKGVINKDGTFTDEQGNVYNLDELNEQAEADFAERFK